MGTLGRWGTAILKIAVLGITSTTAVPVGAALISGYPEVSVRFRDMGIRIDSYTALQSSELLFNAHGFGSLGPCSFHVPDEELPIGIGISSNWSGGLSGPGGIAKGSLSCSLSVAMTVMEESTDDPPGMSGWYGINTGVQIDPLVEEGNYGWTVGFVMKSLQSNEEWIFGEFGRSLRCGPESLPYNTSDCTNFYDYNPSYPVPYSKGEQLIGELYISLFFDLRSVPEPFGLTIPLLILVAFVYARTPHRLASLGGWTQSIAMSRLVRQI